MILYSGLQHANYHLHSSERCICPCLSKLFEYGWDSNILGARYPGQYEYQVPCGGSSPRWSLRATVIALEGYTIIFADTKRTINPQATTSRKRRTEYVSTRLCRQIIRQGNQAVRHWCGLRTSLGYWAIPSSGAIYLLLKWACTRSGWRRARL